MVDAIDIQLNHKFEAPTDAEAIMIAQRIMAKLDRDNDSPQRMKYEIKRLLRVDQEEKTTQLEIGTEPSSPPGEDLTSRAGLEDEIPF